MSFRNSDHFSRECNENYLNFECTNEKIIFPGAAAAAVMSSSKVTTVLRPTSQLPNAAAAQPAVQHIIHQPIQVCLASGQSAGKDEVPTLSHSF